MRFECKDCKTRFYVKKGENTICPNCKNLECKRITDYRTVIGELCCYIPLTFIIILIVLELLS